MGFNTLSIHVPKLIVNHTSGNNTNADATSRLAVSPAEDEVEDIFQTTYLEKLPIIMCVIKDATKVKPK